MSQAGGQSATSPAGGCSAASAASAGLLEREEDVAELSRALLTAGQGVGCLVVVEGPAGIGKSELLAAARAQAEQAGSQRLDAAGIELEREIPFGVATELIEPRLAAATVEDRARLLSGHAGLVAPLLEPGFSSAAADPTVLVRGLYWLVANLTSGQRPQPLVITIDDLQWVDRPSLAFLAYLAARLEELPIALVVASRYGEEATGDDVLAWLRERSDRRVLRPQVLSDDAVGRIVAAGLPGADPAFSRACAEVSGGNPFLACELVRALRADGVPPTARAVSDVRGLVPDSVLRSVLVRLGRLDEPAQRLAAAVAVLGDRTPLRHAAELAELEADTGEAAADVLAKAHILCPGEPLRFTHALIATAIASDIPAFARARAHRRAADLLQVEGSPLQVIAAHLLLTRPDADQHTVSTLRRAAAAALSQGEPGAAVRMLARALEEPPAAEERGRVLLELAEAEIDHGNPRAGARLDQADGLLRGPEDRARALRALARLRFATGEHVAAAETLEQALAHFGEGDPALAPLVAQHLTLTMFRASLHPISKRRLAPLVTAAREGRAPQEPGLLAHIALRMAFGGASADHVRSLAERATRDQPLIDPASYGVLTGIVVQALACVDELEFAEQLADDALGAARRSGSLLSYTMASYHRAIPRYHRGALQDALADLDQALIASDEGWTAGDAWGGALRAHIQIELGDRGAAEAALASSVAVPADWMEASIVQFARARLALADGRPEQALSDALAVGGQLEQGFGIDHPGFIPWRWTAALAAHALDDATRAQALARSGLERAQWSGIPRAMGMALGTVAAIGPDDHRLELLVDAVSVLRRSPSLLARGHALFDLGAAQRRSGQIAAARTPLREALQLAHEMDATVLEANARHELHATGARPRRAAHSGADALTPTERRVAELAAQGLSNPQIAQALFVTTKTIQTHLAHAYRKLDIRSRHHLAHALGASGP